MVRCLSIAFTHIRHKATAQCSTRCQSLCFHCSGQVFTSVNRFVFNLRQPWIKSISLLLLVMAAVAGGSVVVHLSPMELPFLHCLFTLALNQVGCDGDFCSCYRRRCLIRTRTWTTQQPHKTKQLNKLVGQFAIIVVWQLFRVNRSFLILHKSLTGNYEQSCGRSTTPSSVGCSACRKWWFDWRARGYCSVAACLVHWGFDGGDWGESQFQLGIEIIEGRVEGGYKVGWEKSECSLIIWWLSLIFEISDSNFQFGFGN